MIIGVNLPEISASNGLTSSWLEAIGSLAAVISTAIGLDIVFDIVESDKATLAFRP